MSETKKTVADDPLVISVVKFAHQVDIGGVGSTEWSLESASSSQLHGRVRCERKGDVYLFTYSAGQTYQEIEVPLSWCAVTRVPRSRLKETTQAFLAKPAVRS